MAKRKRLTGPQSGFLAEGSAELETKSFPLGAAPPIASVSREAAASAALSELSETVEAARRDGRMVLSVPLDAVDAGHLVRDRIAVTDDEAEALKTSIQARGQQTPIEVTDLGDGRYGLISGWRRLRTLADLHAETGDPAFGQVLALVRQPKDAPDAYVAMVEENEIRVGLSHYERARIVAKAVQQGVYDDATAALRGLFGSAPRAKRSKIKSFLPLVAAFDGVLRFPQAVNEKLGLKLSKALDADPGLGSRICAELIETAPGTPEAETALLSAAMAPAPPPAAAPPRLGVGEACDLTRGVRMAVNGSGEIVLSGPGADAAFRTRLLELFGARGA